jgi:integrase
MSEEKVTLRNPISVQETSKHGKTDVRYWQKGKKLFKPTYTRDGKRFQLDEFAVKLQHQGRRDNFGLGTPNKAAAAAKARDIYVFLQGNGWEKTIAKYKAHGANPKSENTVGEFLDELRATTGRNKTIDGYAVAFRLIVSDIGGLGQTNDRYDYQTGKRDAWLAKVHAIKLASITPNEVQRWKVRFLERAGGNPIKERSAKISVNTLIRRARSLFGKKLVRHLRDVTLPSPLPFEGIDMEERQDMRYRSTFDVLKLIETAKAELSQGYPEQFKIFLLAVMAGLRRDEIDSLEWESFLWTKNAIRIERTETFSPKSEKSLGDIDVDPELIEIFRGYAARAKGRFVIESKNPARPKGYRSQKDIESLLRWLRAQGVKSSKPLHALRKEFGSVLTEQHGIFVASRMLRHSSVAITESHYSDERNRASVGLGYLLSDSNVTPFKSGAGR